MANERTGNTLSQAEAKKMKSLKIQTRDCLGNSLRQGCTTRGLWPDPAPERVISGPQSRLKYTRNFSSMTEILLINLNFIERLTILQLITIQNSSDGNNMKPQAIK